MWILLDISKQWLVKSVFVKPELGKDHSDVGEKIHDYHCFPSRLGKKERLAVWTMIPRFQESMRDWYGWPNIFCVELEIPNTLKRLDNSVCLDSLVLCTFSHSARGWRDIQTTSANHQPTFSRLDGKSKELCSKTQDPLRPATNCIAEDTLAKTMIVWDETGCKRNDWEGSTLWRRSSFQVFTSDSSFSIRTWWKVWRSIEFMTAVPLNREVVDWAIIWVSRGRTTSMHDGNFTAEETRWCCGWPWTLETEILNMKH